MESIVDRMYQLKAAQGEQISQVLHALRRRSSGHRPHSWIERGHKTIVVRTDPWMCSRVKRGRLGVEGEAIVVHTAMNVVQIKGDVRKHDPLQGTQMILGEMRLRPATGNRQVLLLLTRVLLELVTLSKVIGGRTSRGQLLHGVLTMPTRIPLQLQRITCGMTIVKERLGLLVAVKERTIVKDEGKARVTPRRVTKVVIVEGRAVTTPRGNGLHGGVATTTTTIQVPIGIGTRSIGQTTTTVDRILHTSTTRCGITIRTVMSIRIGSRIIVPALGRGSPLRRAQAPANRRAGVTILGQRVAEMERDLMEARAKARSRRVRVVPSLLAVPQGSL